MTFLFNHPLVPETLFGLDKLSSLDEIRFADFGTDFSVLVLSALGDSSPEEKICYFENILNKSILYLVI